MSAPLSPQVPQIDPEEGLRLVEAGSYLLDVRESDEWAAGRAPGAHHVPLGEIPLRLDDVPTAGTVVVVCRAGGRSQQAAEFLRQQGIDAVNLAGGMRAWHAAGLDVVTPDGQAGTVI
ncbi:MAG: rhodanese-like domain-containing protein [Acidimicrobiales bacterium]